MNSPEPLLSQVRLLPQEVIHRIAAGEVVDRPVSVLKELIENSIDAGAGRIRVVLVDGGHQLIEVEDDGGGMTKADLEVAVQRHATSKVSRMEDLDDIHSLGFRGEALSAIASVTRLEIDTARATAGGEIESWTLTVVGGVKRPLQPSGRGRGTRVRAHDLFFNIPARRKFLKKSSSETADALVLLENIALTKPAIGFEWHLVTSTGELKAHRTLPPQTLEERYVALCPSDGEFFSVVRERPTPGVRSLQIVGLKAPASSSFQKSILLSVNDRLVFDKRLPFSMREAFQGLIEMGAYPRVYVRVAVEPSLIDVNIHPQKKEIRWPSGFSLAGMAYSLVRPLFQPSAGMVTAAPTEQMGLLNDARPPTLAVGTSPSRLSDSHLPAYVAPAALSADPRVPESPEPFPPAGTLRRSKANASDYRERVPEFKFSSLRVVGESGAAWIICEHPAGLVLIDQHAAHERINFEKIMCASATAEQELLRTRPLLLPLRVQLPLGIDADDVRLWATLEALGFEFSDPLGPSEFIEFVAVPETDRSVDWSKMLELIFDDLQNDDDPGSIVESLKVRLAASLSCHGSVRRGQRLRHEQIQALLHQMDEVTWGGLCPHGRPLWFLLSNESIADTFHR